jgi:Tfp pilus assembly protein PilF
LESDSSGLQGNQGLILKPQGRNVQAMNNLGLLYDQPNRMVEAKRLYQEAITTQPSYPDVYLKVAFLLKRAGYFMESKRHHHSFLSLTTPKDERAVQRVKKHLKRLP